VKSVHFGDRPYTLPYEDTTQRKEVEKVGVKEVNGRERVEGRREKGRRGTERERLRGQ
jgi:hypothetical protein